MSRIAQIGIAIGALGVMMAFMGLFPGMTGLEPTPGFGIIQMLTVLTGFTLLMFGGLIYTKYAYYATKTATLAQQIGVRLVLTGLVLAAMSGLADLLGYGSHGPGFAPGVLFGRLQATGFVASFFMAAIGVLIYALAGQPDDRHNARPTLRTTATTAPKPAPDDAANTELAPVNDAGAGTSTDADAPATPPVVTIPETGGKTTSS